MACPASCRRILRHHSGVPPSTSSICARSSFSSRGMRQIERDRDAGNAVRREPFRRQPEVRIEGQAARVELALQLGNPGFERAALDGDSELADAEIRGDARRARSTTLRGHHGRLRRRDRGWRSSVDIPSQCMRSRAEEQGCARGGPSRHSGLQPSLRVVYRSAGLPASARAVPFRNPCLLHESPEQRKQCNNADTEDNGAMKPIVRLAPAMAWPLSLSSSTPVVFQPRHRLRRPRRRPPLNHPRRIRRDPETRGTREVRGDGRRQRVAVGRETDQRARHDERDHERRDPERAVKELRGAAADGSRIERGAGLRPRHQRH